MNNFLLCIRERAVVTLAFPLVLGIVLFLFAVDRRGLGESEDEDGYYGEGA